MAAGSKDSEPMTSSSHEAAAPLSRYLWVVLDGFDQHYQASVHLTLSCTINKSPHLELILQEIFWGNSESGTRCSLVWSANATSMLCHPLLILTLSYRILWGCLQSVAPTSVAQLPSPASKSSRQPRSSKVKRGQSPVRGPALSRKFGALE